MWQNTLRIMLNRDLLEKKMKYIVGYIDEIKRLFEKHSVQEVLNESVLLAFAERKYQLLVDTVLDVNTHIISAKDFQPPDDFESTFMTLADRGVLPHKFAIHLAPCVGLRNRVVHKYEKLDLKIKEETPRNCGASLQKTIEFCHSIYPPQTMNTWSGRSLVRLGWILPTETNTTNDWPSLSSRG